MPPRIRLYGKKRGDRRTGSKQWGNVGEMLFYGVILALGAGSFYLLLTGLIWPEWQANQHFVRNKCVVQGKEIRKSAGPEGRPLYQPDIRISFEYQGQPYVTWAYDINNSKFHDRTEAESIVDEFKLGHHYVCWYDPQQPQTVILVRGYSWWIWLLLLVPASFIVLGSLGLARAAYQSGTSAERRASLASRAAHIDLFDDGEARGLDYPSVPPLTHVIDSPGTHLKYRLPVDGSAGWALAGMCGVCLLWNGIVGWLFVVYRTHVSDGQGDWLTGLSLLVFVILGIGITIHCFRQLFLTTALGSTRLEIAEHPFRPGKTYDLFISQSGRLKMDRFRVSLVCEELAIYRQGTDTRTETDQVYEEVVYHRAAVEVGRGLAYEDTCQVTIPEFHMHSFRSRHNEVQWKLIVEADLPKSDPYKRSFPLVIYPSQSEGAG